MIIVHNKTRNMHYICTAELLLRAGSIISG